MKFANLKVGDKVFVVHQKQRNTTEQRTETLEVVKVGRQYAYIKRYGELAAFRLDNGHSHHPDGNNQRSNGLGFDVFRSEQDWIEQKFAQTEYQRLRDRICNGWGLKPLKPETVVAIHKALDEHEIEE